MADDPIERLEQLGKTEVPAPRARFVDGLDSRLRVQHSELRPGRGRARLWWRAPTLVPRLAVAAALVVAGFVGVNALIDDDTTVPLEVADGGAAITPAAESTSSAAAPGDSRPTPTATPTPSPTATASPDVRPTSSAGGAATTPEGAETPTRGPDAGATAVAPTVPPRSTAAPVATAEPTRPATPVPAPTAVAVATPRPVPTARPTRVPTPAPTPGLASIDLVCNARVVGDQVGVLCEWTAPGDGATSYTVFRNRNGGDTEIVATVRATAPRSFADRDVLPGDRVIYVVRASAGDRVVAASERQVVDVPTG